MVKRVKDENAPKRPLSAYLLWANENREAVKEENPDAAMTDLSKILGDKWKALSEGAKKKYQDNFQKKSEKYHKAMEKYKKTPQYAAHAALVKEAKLVESKKPFRKDENAPKRPPTGYLLWTGIERPKYMKKNPEAPVTEVMKALAAQWKDMPESERQKFNDKAAKKKVAYQKELEKYQKTSTYTKYEEEKAAYKAEQSKKRNRLNGVDEKPAKRAKKAKSPKRASKSRSRSKSSRKARASKQPKAAKKRTSRSRSKKRSARESKKPKAPKRRSASTSRSRSRKRSARASAKPKASKRRSVSKGKASKKGVPKK